MLNEQLLEQKRDLARQSEAKMRAAIDHAIAAKIAELLVEGDLANTAGDQKRKRLIVRQIQILGHNRHFISKFANAPLDTSWRARVLGF